MFVREFGSNGINRTKKRITGGESNRIGLKTRCSDQKWA